MKAAIIAVAAVGQMALFGSAVAAVPTPVDVGPDLREAARKRVIDGVSKSVAEYQAAEAPVVELMPSVAQLLAQSREFDAVGTKEKVGPGDESAPLSDQELEQLRELMLVDSLKSLLDLRCSVLTRVEIIQWAFAPIREEPHHSEPFSFEDCCYSMGIIAEDFQVGLRWVLRKDPAYRLAMSPEVIRAFARDLAVSESQLKFNI